MPLSYIEAKDVGKSLGEVETDQLKRYLGSLGNLL